MSILKKRKNEEIGEAKFFHKATFKRMSKKQILRVVVLSFERNQSSRTFKPIGNETREMLMEIHGEHSSIICEPVITPEKSFKKRIAKLIAKMEELSNEGAFCYILYPNSIAKFLEESGLAFGIIRPEKRGSGGVTIRIDYFKPHERKFKSLKVKALPGHRNRYFNRKQLLPGSKHKSSRISSMV